MSKRLLIGVGISALLILVVSIVIVANKGEPSSPANIIEERDGWRTIEHPAFNISFEAPVDWSITVFESGTGYVSGFLGGGTTAAYLSIGFRDDLPNLKVEDLMARISPTEGIPIRQGGLEGISYLGTVSGHGDYDEGNEEDSDHDDIEESYSEGKHFATRGGIIEAECSVIGPEYSSYISVCKDILDSIKKL